MLSRIARGLYMLGRHVERAQNVVRVLEVNHKMNLARPTLDDSNVWAAISESFECGLDQPTEAELYGALVVSPEHAYSVLGSIAKARDQARAMRDHVSEEIWLHLNRTHLDLSGIGFSDVLRIGRSEFNRRIEVFAEALYGLADDTLIRGESWAFLRMGKLAERAAMICRILDIKRKSLALAPELEGAPADVHQWQALLRSLSGYEPYRRAFDARVIPSRVLEFVMKQRDFPRSLICTVADLRATLDLLAREHAAQVDAIMLVERFVEDLYALDTAELVAHGTFEAELRRLDARCRAVDGALELGYFTSLRPVTPPITAVPGAALVSQ